jgi:hypothetical protein
MGPTRRLRPARAFGGWQATLGVDFALERAPKRRSGRPGSLPRIVGRVKHVRPDSALEAEIGSIAVGPAVHGFLTLPR